MRIILHGCGEFNEWRESARALLMQGVMPRDVNWHRHDEAAGLFGMPPMPVSTAPVISSHVTVPPAFLDLAESVICHSDPGRFDLAYRLLWRIQTDKALLQVRSDPDVARAHALNRSVHRDSHKMHAFVRFREVPSEGSRRAFVAWFEPDHWIVARNAGFFHRRFNDMDWLIATPKGSAAWDGTELRIDSHAAIKPDIDDDMDDLWRTYFANIFNPARLKVKMMQTEMPKKYWKNLPEADLIPDLIAGAEDRVREMAARQASQGAPKFHGRLQGRQKRD